MTPESLIWISAIVAAYAAATTLAMWLAPILARCGAVTRPGPGNVGRAVPRGGGLAIVLPVVVAAVIAGWSGPEVRAPLLAWLVPATCIAAVSLCDDFRPLPAVMRLAIHVIAAIAVVVAIGPLSEISFGELGRVSLGVAAWPFTMLWIVGMTNAFNFMDGIDGMAGLTAVVAGATLAVASFAAGCEPVAIIGAVFASASAGFLSSNWPPAKLFMGDVGSTLCGFTIAVLPLAIPAAGRATVIPVALLAMWPFVFDASTTFFKRFTRCENVLKTHHGHIYQRLVIAGWSHRRVASLYGLLAAFGGSAAAASIALPSLRPVFEAAAAGSVLATPALLVAAVTATESGALRAV